MRIAFVLPPGEIYDKVRAGAIATITNGLASELHRRGHEPYTLSASVDEPLGPHPLLSFEHPTPLHLGEKVLERLTLRVGRRDHWQQASYIKQVDGKLRSLKPDRVVVHNEPALAAALVRRGHDVTMYLHNEFSTRALAQTFRSLSDLRRIITVSDYLRTWAQPQRWAPADVQYAAIPSGIDLERFYPQNQPQDPDRAMSIGYLGRLDPTKGADVAIAAVGHLLESGANVRLSVRGPRRFNDIYGDVDGYICRLHELATPYEAITISPPVPPAHVPNLMRSLDALVIPTLCNEGLSLVALEAVASGVPIVASRLGGLPEAVLDCGMLVNPSPLAFAEALAQLSRPDVLASYRQACLARRPRLAWSLTTDAFLKAVS